MEHRARQLAGEGVLLARVVGADERHSPRQTVRRAVPELGRGRRAEPSLQPARSQVVVEGDLAQCDHHAQARKKPQLVAKEPAAPFEFAGRRLVSWRRATDSGADVAIPEHKPVAPVRRRRLIRESVPVQGFIEPVPAAIAGEHAPRPIPAVGRRCQPEDINARVGITEPGDRPPPIGPILELTAFRLGDFLPVGDQTRAGGALGNGGVEQAKGPHRGRQCSMNGNGNPLAGPWASC